MKKNLSKDDNAWMSLIIGNPMALAIIAMGVIIWLTAKNPGLALSGFILLILPIDSRRLIKISIPKMGLIISSPISLVLFLIGYGVKFW